MRRRHTGPGFVDELLEPAVAKISEHEPRRPKRIGRKLLLDFRIDAAGDEKKVGQAVVVQIDDARPPSHVSCLDAKSGADRDVVEVAVAVVPIQHVGVVGEVGLENIEVPVEIVVADRDAHARLLESVFAQRDAALEPLLAKGAVVLVAKQPARRRIARDVDVGPSVVVVIGGHGRHRIGTLRGGDAGLAAHVGERAVAVVAKQLSTPGGQPARTAVHRHPFPPAVRVLTRSGQLLECRLEVLRDEEIEPAVAIVVDPRAPRAVAHRLLSQAGLPGHVRKRAVAVVVIQHVVAVVGDEEIVKSVVVVVADCHRRGPSGVRQARLLGHIGERAVAIVLVKPVGSAGWSIFEARAAQNQEIEPAVVVVVEKRHAAADDLDDVALGVDAPIDHRRGQT